MVLLIDEIDKADIEFPNDLLRELDRMEFYVYETKELVQARHRPVVFITSNNEKELPDAFLRRCFFHYIRFPDKETMERIVDVHFPGLKKNLLREALEVFFEMREVPGLKKKPSTSELLDWLKLLLAEDIPPEALRARTARPSSRRSTGRCSRTSRTCTCSSGSSSWRGRTGSGADATATCAVPHCRAPRRCRGVGVGGAPRQPLAVATAAARQCRRGPASPYPGRAVGPVAEGAVDRAGAEHDGRRRAASTDVERWSPGAVRAPGGGGTKDGPARPRTVAGAT